MKALLDTHTFLWWVTNNPLLSTRVEAILHDRSNQIFVSAATGWEIAIKSQIGKLNFPTPPEAFMLQQLALNSFVTLPIRLEHGLQVYHLPLYHRDPFDRILIAQGQLEGMPILTADSKIAQYGVDVIW
jgi:PIN domain nuclease of toxin-antitoxin system